MKRLFDITVSFLGLMLTVLFLIPICVLIWLQDFHSPFYIAPRVGKDGKIFKMVKLRSMIIDADKTGVDSTSSQDKRITPIGRFVRAYKLDEIPQLWNVLKGEMSFVGPRPNVKREVDLYTEIESNLLTVQPGITDISSIVFSDLNDILKNSQDPNLDYNQLVRPWKSRLSLVYVENQSFWLDIRLIFLTAVALVSRPLALEGVNKILLELDVDKELCQIASRQTELYAFPPPGASDIVRSRG
ncbi:sugar transferase [Crocosphaera watsonii]|uniref:Sugar transferase involved in lipopolysaccharide synthesis-like n=3 Tax=Crocosphaera watsonii TaxID=263511 RepID=T2JGH4_CROWT|nr:sugar transferase [Crocosphaera watsonii]EHJ11778.1 Sugar transferase involved in lipopolysaccharide synthesis [Crocosphaera watsonii WH 0003]CCQ53681.1 Sugar transferase involved in lipopolysaccharide synthesis-like [Crocosphaera watsonii WH 0005]CCQ64923.1 Sugar transferase involved in lipopolysaccharide synthesis-like [Crocosphaera watsonii WH 0402]